MTGIHFTDPGQIIETVKASAETLLTALNDVNAPMELGTSSLHAGRLSNTNGDPIGFEFGVSSVLYLHPFLGNKSLNRRDDGSLILSEIPASLLSVSTTSLVDGTYDVFEYDNDGEAAIEVRKWTGYNNRGYTLSRDPLMGFISPIDNTRKWRGSFWTFTNSIYQNSQNQAIYNAFNRRQRVMNKAMTAGTAVLTPSVWNYATSIIMSIISPMNDTQFQVSFQTGISVLAALMPIGIATKGYATAYTYPIKGRVSTADQSVLISGVAQLNEGYQIINGAWLPPGGGATIVGASLETLQSVIGEW